jgi:GxxExxY protein
MPDAPRSRPPVDDPETYAIIGAAMEVHRVLGCGYLEAVYRAALSSELRARCIPFSAEVTLPIHYKSERLPLHYRVDFVCYESILVEVKAATALGAADHAQTINYLRASDRRRALIFNFGAVSLQHKRVLLK